MFTHHSLFVRERFLGSLGYKIGVLGEAWGWVKPKADIRIPGSKPVGAPFNGSTYDFN
jgi:hypothetical protein